MKRYNRKYIKNRRKKKDQNLVLDRIPHQVLAKLSSFGFVLAEKEPIIIYITRNKSLLQQSINKIA